MNQAPTCLVCGSTGHGFLPCPLGPVAALRGQLSEDPGSSLLGVGNNQGIPEFSRQQWVIREGPTADWSSHAPRIPIRTESYTLVMKQSVPHGESFKFRLSHDHLYKAKRLVVAPECAAYYEILEVMVNGKFSFIADGAPMPGTAFPPLPEVLVDAEKIRSANVFSEAVMEQIPKLIALFNKFDFPTLLPGCALAVTVRHKDKCPVHTDCISMGSMCCDIPFHAWFEGTVAY